jgi:predicted  nucleic acid-binding Zn-ribbon protein
MENKIKKNINLLLLLQNIDNRINSILNVKNELPKEIDKLKNDILIYKNNLSELREEFLKVENNFKEKKKKN